GAAACATATGGRLGSGQRAGGEIPRRGWDSVRFRARQLDHFRPLLGFIHEQLGEVGGRAGQRRATELGDARLHLGIGKGGVEFAVERLDDGGGRARGGGARI